jgi:hypothetical protein
MDDELLKFEAELKALRPVAPKAELRDRIARELPAATRARAGWWWTAVPAAAALAIALVLAGRKEPPLSEGLAAAQVATFRPVAAEKVLYAAADEGPVTLADGTAGRRVRSSYVDTITWKNPKTNASLRWSVPRDEVRVMPVVFQ